jgi:hypothetical protein
MTIEAEGLVSSPLQDGGCRGVEARFNHARMMLLYLLLRGEKKANVEDMTQR